MASQFGSYPFESFQGYSSQVPLCTDKPEKGMVRSAALTTMDAAQWNNELYIVFGNHRLKALQDACSRGMRSTRVDCIVQISHTARLEN